jgi:hypothetical protein
LFTYLADGKVIVLPVDYLMYGKDGYVTLTAPHTEMISLLFVPDYLTDSKKQRLIGAAVNGIMN